QRSNPCNPPWLDDCRRVLFSDDRRAANEMPCPRMLTNHEWRIHPYAAHIELRSLCDRSFRLLKAGSVSFFAYVTSAHGFDGYGFDEQSAIRHEERKPLPVCQFK